jgi:hypothetical protein
MTFPAPDVAQAVGAQPVRWEPASGSGYGINTSRWRVELADGGSVFVKVALDDLAAGWLRQEHNVYASVAAPFIPQLRGWHDAEQTLLAMEDLSDAHWPPPWPQHGVPAVLAALDEVHAAAPPPGLGRLEELREPLDGWPRIAADPAPCLSLGLCSAEWLDGALLELAAASAACELAGDAFLHLDVRSDNLCLVDGRAVLVDWNWANVGNPLIDVVAWLPSLRLEGGPEPWEIVSDSRGLSALMAGFFLSLAGLPAPATAPKVRDIQRRQGEVALAWAARELGLPRLDSQP